MTETRFALDQMDYTTLVALGQIYDPDTSGLTPGLADWVGSVRILLWGEALRILGSNRRALDDDIYILVNAAQALTDEERQDVRLSAGETVENTDDLEVAEFHKALINLVNQETTAMIGEN